MYTNCEKQTKPRIEYDPMTKTLQPSVTGSMICGLTYDKGVLLAADTMGSYGGLRRYKDMQRVIKISETCLIAASGDLADLSELERIVMDQVRLDAVEAEHGVTFNAQSLHAWIQTIFYHHRCKMNPYWLTVAVAGWDSKKNKPFLGIVDQKGVSYSAPHVVTGFGGMMAGPYLELRTPEDHTTLTLEQAEKQLRAALSVVTYRDKKTLNSWTIGKVTADSCDIIANGEELPTNWDLAHMILGYE